MSTRQIWLAECASEPNGVVHTRQAASKRRDLYTWITSQGWQPQELKGVVRIEEIIWRKHVHSTWGEVLYMRTSALSLIDE